MSSEPPLLTLVLSVLSRLHSLVSESLHERKKAMGLEASRASVDLSDVQTRAMGTLGALEVLDGSFDDFPLVKEILLQVKGLNLPWEDIGVSCAQAAAEGSFGVVESQLLGLLWSPRFESLKATLLKEIEACVEVLMKQAGSGGLAKSLPPLPPMRYDLNSVTHCVRHQFICCHPGKIQAWILASPQSQRLMSWYT